MIREYIVLEMNLYHPLKDSMVFHPRIRSPVVQTGLDLLLESRATKSNSATLEYPVSS